MSNPGVPGWDELLPPERELQLPGRGTLTVRDSGSGTGTRPTVLLLHGWTVTSDVNWFTVLPALADRYRVVAFDHRGHGRGIRTTRRFRIADCADDAAAVLDSLGIDRCITVGYSMGGAVAQLLWKRHRPRVQGLVLCSTSRNFRGRLRDKVEFPLLWPIQLAARAIPDRVVTPVFERIVDSQTRGRDIDEWLRAEIKLGDARTWAEAGTAIGNFNSAEWVAEIQVPTAVVVTDGDSIVPTSRQLRLADAIEQASVWQVEGDHDVIVSDPDRYLPPFLEAIGSVAADVS